MKEYKITKTITAEQIDNILDAALYTGIAYWANDLEVVTRPTEPGATAMSEFLTRGGKLAIVEDETGKQHELTVDVVLKGLSLYEHSNYDEFDANDADNIIQLGLFGEIVYS
jgi:hypothetical protein